MKLELNDDQERAVFARVLNPVGPEYPKKIPKPATISDMVYNSIHSKYPIDACGSLVANLFQFMIDSGIASIKDIENMIITASVSVLGMPTQEEIEIANKRSIKLNTPEELGYLMTKYESQEVPKVQ